MEVEGNYTDCRALRAQTNRSLMPKTTTAQRAVNKAPMGIVNDDVACAVNAKSPLCGQTRRTNGDRVATANRILYQAHQNAFRSVESAVNRSAVNRMRYDQAVCSKLVVQAKSAL